jgi:hypothetical protein
VVIKSKNELPMCILGTGAQLPLPVILVPKCEYLYKILPDLSAALIGPTEDIPAGMNLGGGSFVSLKKREGNQAERAKENGGEDAGGRGGRGKAEKTTCNVCATRL